MLIAAINDTPYDIVYLLHIISVILGTGAAFVVPFVAGRARRAGADITAFDDAIASILAPSLLATGVFGGALVGMSDDVYDFSQTWLAIAGPVWLRSEPGPSRSRSNAPTTPGRTAWRAA